MGLVWWLDMKMATIYRGEISLHIPCAASALHVEVIALCSALELVGRRQRSAVDIECDCAALVAAVERSEEDLSEIGRIVEDYKAYLVGISSIIIRHIFHEANGLVHMITHLVSSQV